MPTETFEEKEKEGKRERKGEREGEPPLTIGREVARRRNRVLNESIFLAKMVNMQ